MGGRGSSSSLARATGAKRGLTFGRRGRGKGVPAQELYPSYMNGAKNTGSIDTVAKSFREKHAQSDVEYAIHVNERGYTTGYWKGQAGSVTPTRGATKGTHMFHNHPKGGWANFSGTDLNSWASGDEAGSSTVSANAKPPAGANKTLQRAYANRKAGEHRIVKTGHFKGKEFRSAIRHIKVRDDNYDKDLGKWLRKNASKYGYKYDYFPAKNKPY